MQEQFKGFVFERELKDSSEWVALRILFIFASGNGTMKLSRFIENYFKYYQRRIDGGLEIDKKGSTLLEIPEFTLHNIANFLKEGPLKNLSEQEFIVVDETEQELFIGFQGDLWASMSHGDRALMLAAIEDGLEDYFTNHVPYPKGALPIPCVFCQREKLGIVKENTLAFTVFDIYPAVPGHCLIIPKRHVRDVFGINKEEFAAMLELLQEMKELLESKYRPDGYNVGFNTGYAAGQTVMHAHMHCFPRKWGDVPNPHGGLRNIIPNWHKLIRT